MKCLAQKEYQKKIAEQIFLDTAQMFICFVDASVGCILHRELGFGKERLIKFFNYSYDLLNKYIKKYSDDLADDRDDMDMASFVLKRDLNNIGFEAETLKNDALKRRIDAFETLHTTPKARARHKQRKEYTEYAEMPLETYYLGTMMYLHDEYGLGKDRLTKLYNLMEDEYNQFVGYYLLTHKMGDMGVNEMIKRRQNELREIGIPFRNE